MSYSTAAAAAVFPLKLSNTLNQSPPSSLPLIHSTFTPFPSLYIKPLLFKHHFTSKSIVVYVSNQQDIVPKISEDKDAKEDIVPNISNDIDAKDEDAKDDDAQVEDLDFKRPVEKFAVLNTGISECRSCGYLYDQAVGDPSYPVPPGLPFDKLSEDWRCPTCGASKSFFDNKSVEIAGFAENQQYGLGGNTLTSGQKALLIYGGLLFAFMLFLSGYFLQ